MNRLTQSELFSDDKLPDTNTSEKLAIGQFRSILDNAKARLEEYHLESGSAATLVKYHSWLIDRVLTAVWKHCDHLNPHREVSSLIAAGGYGREELNLQSDIDLLILLPEKTDSTTNDFVEAFIRFCWDIGLKVGHSARTIKECIQLSRQDITIFTTLMETRLLTGNPKSFEDFQIQIRNPKLWPERKYFKEKLKEQQNRHIHFGDTAYNLEPNIKETPGGLRDLHMISWVANRHFQTGDLNELVEHGFLTNIEYRTLIKGRNVLWRMRNGLHLLAGRSEDRLLFDHQHSLADQLGYKKGENHLAVEQMMKKYYRTVKELQLLNELLLQHFQEAILTKKAPRTRKINRRFQSVDGYLEVTNSAVFSRTPSSILELFLILQQNPRLKGIRASTIRLLRSNLAVIDKGYRENPENQRIFLDIFKHQSGLTHSLRRMNAYGVLGMFFPDFGKIVGQMQHDLFHIYTVDAHSLFVVRNLRRFMLDKHESEFPELNALMGQQNKRERLFLAALCHDIGKGSGKDHSVVGESISFEFCQNIGLSEYDAQFVSWLVRNHLSMSWIAQREDISDPAVIDRFAEIVGDQQHLDHLYLLTVADIRGTSHKVWNEWKGKLLANLYAATSRRLRSGIKSVHAVEDRIKARKTEIKKLLSKSSAGRQLDSFWSLLSDDYFLRHGSESSSWQARMISSANLLDIPFVASRFRHEIKARQILIMAPESELLLSKVTAGLDNQGINIFDARFHQMKNRMTLMIVIGTNSDEVIPSEKNLEKSAEDLKRFLLSTEKAYTPVKRITSRALKQFPTQTSINFIHNENNQTTTMELVTQDRPGLLYHVAATFLHCKVKLVSAKISTMGERAEDTFIITNRDGLPVHSDTQQECIQEHLMSSLMTNISK